MKKLTLLLLFMFVYRFLFSQAPDTAWIKTYGGPEWEIANSIQQTADGGFIIAGPTNSYGAGGNDVYLIKTDANGDTLWTRVYGGTGDEEAYSVRQTIDGGYILSGKTRLSGGTKSDLYLIRTDLNGDTLWTVTEGGIEVDESNAVIETDDGYFISTGTTRSYGQGGADIYFLETSPAGDTIWDDTFGGAANDYGYAVQQTSDGYILATSSANFGAGNFDAWLVRIDWDYNIIWHKSFGGSEGEDAYDVQLTADGGFIGAGRTGSFGPGDYSFFLFKANSGGDSLWAKVFGGENRDEARSVKQTPDGGYIMAGTTRSFGAGDYDFYVVRTDANGDSLWTRTFGGAKDDECFTVELTDDGGYVLAGSSESFGAGNADFYVVKLMPETVGIKENISDPTISILNTPNPFAGITEISYQLEHSSFVSLKILDLNGQKIMDLVNEYQHKGKHSVEFNSPGLKRGMYLCELLTENGKCVVKMIRL